MGFRKFIFLASVAIKGHILNPFWLQRNQRRGVREEVRARAIARYFHPNIVSARKVSQVPVIHNDKNEKIYSLWGWNPKPKLVDACFRSIEKNATQDFIALDEKTLFNYIDLPGFIMDLHKNGKMKNAHFADIARVELLHNHGGFWMDSTNFMTSPIPDNIIDTDFFMYMANGKFGTPYGFVQNCFIRSRRGDYLLNAWRAVIHDYWSKNDHEFEYFQHQIMFKGLVAQDRRAKQQFEKMPKICQDPTHLLWAQYRNKPFDKQLFDKITSGAFFQKTMYRDVPNLPAGSFGDEIIKGD